MAFDMEETEAIDTRIPCEICSNNIRLILDSSNLAQQELKWHSELRQLQAAAKSCSLCAYIWDLSMLESYSDAIARFSGSVPDPSSAVALKVRKLSETNGVSWAVLNTEMRVREPGVCYNDIDTIGISRLPRDGATSHPAFWTREKAGDEESSSSSRNKLLMEWLQDCERNHELCQPAAERYPTRILCVEVEQPLRLVSRDQILLEGGPARYATLSHSWGNHVPLKTTRATKSTFEKSIPEDLLPRTFKDAVSIARALGIHYLWIDSLCIVQDDPDDWQAEALEMQNIYSGSTINIAASDAVDSNGGCFGPGGDVTVAKNDDSTNVGHSTEAQNVKGGTREPRFIHYEHGNEPGSTMIRFHIETARQIQSRKHLSTRGWVLQEEILSHRIIHCSRSEIYWQCKFSYKTQSGQILDPLEVFREPGEFHVDPARREERMWYEWIEDYSSRNFTFPSDRIPAMSGIVNHYHKLSGQTPALGLWEESFAEGLLWVRLGALTAPCDPGIPSWTWLSCNASILFDHMQRSLPKDGKTIQDHVVLHRCHITWTGLPNVSNVKSSDLVIRGPITEICLRVAPDIFSNFSAFEIQGDDLDKSSLRPGSCCGQFDDPDVATDTFSAYPCVLVRSVVEPGSTSYTATYLILQPVTGSSNDATKKLPRYRRIGIGYFDEMNRCFSSAENTEFMLC
ncbi:heterokaryon incompatibility protein-domain-containing protein [Fusarium avenaceum]|nr:heterokaryon incompatibility protein-domain-containing protein [Fusarium avenaceum]